MAGKRKAGETLARPTPRPPQVITDTNGHPPLSREFKLGLAITLTVAVVGGGVPWWLTLDHDDPAGAGTASPVSGMSGGCEPFQVFAQNRYEPVGTAIREAPNVMSNQIGSFPANMSISVNGWVHGRAAYPTNEAPFNNDVWYHLSNGSGWVSFAGVRGVPTKLNKSGLSHNGGTPVAMSPACEGSVR